MSNQERNKENTQHQTSSSAAETVTPQSGITPGPWAWDGNVCDYDKENEAPWLISFRERLPMGPVILGGEIECNNPANARLIAAAPDLLEAVIEAHRHKKTYHNPGKRTDICFLCKAIAKANAKD